MAESVFIVRDEAYRVIRREYVPRAGRRLFGRFKFTLVKIEDNSRWFVYGNNNISRNARLTQIQDY